MSIAERAKEVYELELRSRLEATHCGQFVAIEPVSTCPELCWHNSFNGEPQA